MSYERFARQYRFEPPSGFPLTLPCTSIVHHLSGPSMYAHARHRARMPQRAARGAPAFGFSRSLSYLRTRVSITLVLAHMLDSLVRVSRRVGSHQNGTPS